MINDPSCKTHNNQKSSNIFFVENLLPSCRKTKPFGLMACHKKSLGYFEIKNKVIFDKIDTLSFNEN